MKKIVGKKLALNRESLRRLDKPALAGVEGAMLSPSASECTNGPSNCGPCISPTTT